MSKQYGSEDFIASLITKVGKIFIDHPFPCKYFYLLTTGTVFKFHECSPFSSNFTVCVVCVFFALGLIFSLSRLAYPLWQRRQPSTWTMSAYARLLAVALAARRSSRAWSSGAPSSPPSSRRRMPR